MVGNSSAQGVAGSLIIGGRFFLGLYFFLPGLMKLVQWNDHIALLESRGFILVPAFLLAAALLEIAGGVLIAWGKYVFSVSLTLAALVIAINFSLHDFWNFSDVEGRHELQNFVKNMAVFGGLLVLAGYSKNV